jgi:beta-1,4-mannosyl-glycoprotein beta-1,4-N-acetylglucosaminyltransferase
MVIDSCIFLEENDLLRRRLEALWDEVDYFLVVEANKTFTNIPKGFNFDPLYLNGYMQKVIYRTININGSSPWLNESVHRNAIGGFLELFPLDTTVLISDVDEIPKNIHLLGDHELTGFRQDLYYYNMENPTGEKWCGTVALKNATLQKYSSQWAREKRNCADHYIEDGGVHLSYFGGPERIRRKLESFAHTEFNRPEFKNIDHIQKCIYTGEDLFGRETRQ